MWEYIYYGMGCVFDSVDAEQDKKDNNKFRNYGECDDTWVFIIGYTLSLFVI